MAKGTALNLDELFGTQDPVLVVYLGKEYELKRPDSWSPKQYAEYISLQRTMTWHELEGMLETESGFEKLSETITRMLSVISPELAELGLSLDKRSKIIEHYARIVFPEQMKIADEKLKNMTGA